jgi:hypothetical protein
MKKMEGLLCKDLQVFVDGQGVQEPKPQMIIESPLCENMRWFKVSSEVQYPDHEYEVGLSHSLERACYSIIFSSFGQVANVATLQHLVRFCKSSGPFVDGLFYSAIH